MRQAPGMADASWSTRARPDRPLSDGGRERAMGSSATEVAVVGGGLAGAAVAARLAGAGHEVVLFERWPEPRWRACGVYSSPATPTALHELGLPDERVRALVRPISELVVESLGGPSCRLVHGAAGPAVGVDRVRLERALLDRAAELGARIHEGAVVRSVEWEGPTNRRTRARLVVSTPHGPHVWRTRLVVGADGPHSLVARSAGASRGRARVRRAGLTVHRSDPDALPEGSTMSARLVFGQGWYCGVTPVPGARVNVGVVIAAGRFRRQLREVARPDELVESIARQIPPSASRSEAWRTAGNTDRPRVAFPLAHHVRRLSGPGYLLVGDAAGFVDPVSGEGIHRAFLSAAEAADAIRSWRAGDQDALLDYDRRLRSRFARKDLISWLLQVFMTRPRLLDYAVRRLERRERVRRTFGMVMSDLAPPERALDPRFLAALLAP
jgi:flavin-dependent dehydrogenase